MYILDAGLRAASRNTRGLLGSTPSPQCSGEQSTDICNTWSGITTSSACKKHMGNEFVQALLVLHTKFRMVGTFLNGQVNAGGSAILIRKTLLHGDVVLRHLGHTAGSRSYSEDPLN